MEDEQEIKQSFLRKEILEKNYDANVFLEFLITKKGEIASDINNWTIEELHTVVSEFKNSQNENQKENISTNQPSSTRKDDLVSLHLCSTGSV